ncbi:MAG: TetR family transcriptional regulator [Actinomycetes bacterium]
MAAGDEVRASVVDAARALFRARGYVGTTFKGVAAAAGVAPEVVRRYYDNKETLFAAVLQLPVDPASAIPRLLAPGLDGMGERLVKFVLDTLGDPKSRDELIALFQSGAAAGRAAGPLAEFLQESVIDRVVRAVGVPDARLRVALISSYLVGIAATRFILKIEPIASMPDDELIQILAPTVQDWLTPTRPLPGVKFETS